MIEQKTTKTNDAKIERNLGISIFLLGSHYFETLALSMVAFDGKKMDDVILVSCTFSVYGQKKGLNQINAGLTRCLARAKANMPRADATARPRKLGKRI